MKNAAFLSLSARTAGFLGIIFFIAAAIPAYADHYQAIWTNGAGTEMWSDAGNWDIATVPLNGTDTFDVVIPAGFNVYFDVDTASSVTDIEIASGSTLYIDPGHNLDVLDDSLITGTLVADGVSTAFGSTAVGAAFGDGGRIIATGGAFAESAAASYSSKTLSSNITLFSADGVDTRIDLSSLQTLDCAFTAAYRTQIITAINSGFIDMSSVGAINGPTNGTSRLNFEINSSGYIDLSNLTDILGGYVRFIVDVPGYTLNSLISAKATTFDIGESSGIYAPNLNLLDSCSVNIADNTTFNAPALTSFVHSGVSLTPLKTFTTASLTNTDNSRFVLTEGALFGTSYGDINATGYSGTGLNSNYTVFSASGSGTILDLSSYEVLNDAFTAGYRTNKIEAFDNGFIDLSSVSTLYGATNGTSQTRFNIDTGGDIDFSALTEIPSGYVYFNIDVPAYSLPALSSATTTTFDASAASTINLPQLTTLASSRLTIEDGGTINAPNLTSITSSALNLTPLKTLVTGELNHLDNTQIGLSEGAEFGTSYGDITATGYSAAGLNNNYTVFSAVGTDTVLDLTSFEILNDAFTAAYRTHTFHASDGGLVDLSNVGTLYCATNGTSSSLFSIDNGGLIDFSSLVNISSGHSHFNIDIPMYSLPALENAVGVNFDASSVSTIDMPVLTIASGCTMTIEDGGTIEAPALVSFTNGVISLNPLKTLETGPLSNIDNSRFYISDGAMFGTAYGDVTATSYSGTGLNNNYTLFTAAGTDTVLDLSSLEAINDAFTASYHSHYISASNNATIDLSGVVTFSGTSIPSSKSHIDAETGATILFGDGLSVSGYTQITATAATISIGGGLNINSPSRLSLLEGATLNLAGDLIFNTTDETAMNLDAGVLAIASPSMAKLEVGGENLDLGGASEGNFGIGQLQVGSSSQPTTVMLVDLIDNGNRTSGGEALYLYGSGALSGLRIRPDSKLIIGDVDVYVNTGAELVHINSLFGPGQKWIPYDEGVITLTEYDCSLTADVTGDCVVNLDDLAVMSGEWLECGDADCP